MPWDGLLPKNWLPRPDQAALWQYLLDGGKRAVEIAHRRWGKDDVALHWTAVASQDRVGTYWHMLPEASQARKAIWEAVNPMTGMRRIDEAFPAEIRTVRETDMFIRFTNGSTWQVVGSDNFNCYSADTEILTLDGWKLFSALTKRDRVATLEAGDVMRFSPLRAIMQHDYDGEMWSVRNNAIDLLTTPNHKFYVESGKGIRKFKRIDDKTILGDKIPATCRWEGSEPKTCRLPDVVDRHPATSGAVVWDLEFEIEDWCAFMGIFLAEGSTWSDANGNYRVVISQKKTAPVARIRELLGRMGLRAGYYAKPGNFVIHNRQLYEYCKQFGLCDQKFIPNDLKVLSPRLLGILVEWMVLGDGHVTKGGTLSYASTSKRLIDDFQEVAIKLGWSGNIRTQSQAVGRIRGREIFSTLPLYVFYRRLSKYKFFKDTKESYLSTKPYKGKVWCVDAGSHVIKVRRNGKEAWCGNSLMGAPPIGVVFSEWALANPQSWRFIRPILEQNGGWAIFITTPRGRNHAQRMYDMAEKTDGWFAELSPASKTKVFTPEQLARIRQEMIDEFEDEDEGEAIFLQEYEVKWDAPLIGSYYAKLISRAESEGRINDEVRAIPGLPVETAWDLGHTDDTAIWWFQILHDRVLVLKYYFNSGEDVPFYCDVLHEAAKEHGWDYGGQMVQQHWVPWDARPKTLAAPRNILEQAWDCGIKMRIAPNVSKQTGIQSVRKLLPTAYFNKTLCEDGLEALRGYRRKWDDERKVYSKDPLHSWESHGADAMRYLALAWRQEDEPKPPEEAKKLLGLESMTFDQMLDIHDREQTRRWAI